MWSPPPVRDMNGKLKDYSVVYRPLKEWEGERGENHSGDGTYFTVWAN